MTKRQRIVVTSAMSTLMLASMAKSGLAEVPASALIANPSPAPIISLPSAKPDVAALTRSAGLAAGADVSYARPATPDTAQVECVAKVVFHEASNQPRDGQIAVAQVIRTRVRAGRYGADACAVVAQPGQFFDVRAYNPPRTDARWSAAVAIASRTLAGEGEEIVPGALFFHASSSPMTSRVRVAQIADHIFYR